MRPRSTSPQRTQPRRARLGALRLNGALLALLALLAPLTALAAPSINISVNRDEISIQQTVRLTVEMSLEGSRNANIAEPAWATQGWSVVSRSQSTSMQLFGRQQSLEMTYTYTLKPTRVGELDIGPFEGEGVASGLTSNALRVKVTEGAPKVSAEQARVYDSYALLRWEPKKTEVWLGERVEVALALYVNTQLRVTHFAPPDINLQGFWVEDIEADQRSRRARVGQQTYYRQDVKRSLLSPLRAGELPLPGVSATLRVSSLGFFSEEDELTQSAPVVPVIVKPLPPGAPSDFKGPAVGSVRAQLTVDRTRVRLDEGVQLNIITTTDGLLSNTPPFELPVVEGLRSFTPTSRESHTERDGKTLSTRTQTWLLKPTRPGGVTIPELRLPFFNPVTGQYEVATTPATRLEVSGGDPAKAALPQVAPAAGGRPPQSPSGVAQTPEVSPTEADRLGVQLRTIRTTALPLSATADLVWLWWALGVGGLVLWCADELRRLLRRARASGASRVRPERAHAEVERALSALSASALDYQALNDAVGRYLEARLGVDARGAPRAQVRARLLGAGLSVALADGYEGLCEAMDLARFAPAGAASAQGSEVLALTRAWLGQVEQALRAAQGREGERGEGSRGAGKGGAGKGGAGGGGALALALAAGLSTLAGEAWSQPRASEPPPSAPAPLAVAHERFWAGDYPAAAAAYRAAVKEDPDDPTPWYNLGTAEAHAGRYGEAAHALRAALLRAPHDHDARAQLSLVEQVAAEDGVRRPGPRRLVLPEEGAGSGAGLLGLLPEGVARAWTLLSLSLLSLALLGARRGGAGELSPAWAARAPQLRALATLALASTLLGGALWRARVAAEEGVSWGVVVEARAPLHRGPGAQFPADVSVAGAALVRLQGLEGEWRRVSLSDGREGWLRAGDVRAVE
jgi:tetratricopeptide (TPR) repeat protein